TRWLGLQLTREGYRIWSDVTKLIGGELTWSDIEEAIRNYTIKFLFVLSRASNIKQGTLDELHLANTVSKVESIRDFTIPLRLDDLPFSDMNVAIHRRNAIDFTQSWAQGLANVLRKLDKDLVPKDIDLFNPSTVASWWKSQFDGTGILQNTPEQYLSNWFPINGLPETMYVHSLGADQSSLTRGEENLPFPAYPIRDCVVSFASAEDLGLQNVQTTSVSISECLDGTIMDMPINARQGRNALIYLLRQAWLSCIESISLPFYEMANERQCAYFTQDMFESKLQFFEIPDCISGRRSLVGQSKTRYWHFGFSADIQLEPILVYIVRPHVLFSDDGKNIWSSSDRMHRTRRSVCKNWWNDRWRDLILASMYWLAQKQSGYELVITLSSDANLQVVIKPITFESPVSYDDSSVAERLVLDDDESGDEGIEI
ncbi:toll/interleukin-1 receptor domain-containing protein, partial [Candidatus Poribacteria bacterium]